MSEIYLLLVLLIVIFLFSLGFVSLLQKTGKDWIYSALSGLGVIGVILSLMYYMS